MRFVMYWTAAIMAIVLAWPALAATQRDRYNCEANDPDRSIAGCTRILQGRRETDQNRAFAYNHRDDAWRDKGDLEKAIADYSDAIGVDPKYADAYNGRAMAWRLKGEYDRAIADYSEAIRLNPKYTDAYYNRANAWSDKGDLDRAIADYSEVIQLNPKYAGAYYDRGTVWRYKGDLEQAIADYNETIRLDPKDSAAYLSRGIANLFAGSLPNGVADFNRASELEPKDAYAALWLHIVSQRSNLTSRLAQASGQLDMAKWPAPLIRLFLGQSTQEAVLAVADDPNAKNKQGQVCEANFYIGELALIQGTKEKAADFFRLAAADCPDSHERWAANAELKALDLTPQSRPHTD